MPIRTAGASRRPSTTANGFSRTNAVLALLYVALALPISACFALATVPYGVPDEAAQFFRAIQVGRLGFLSVAQPGGNAGGSLPEGAIQSFAADGLVHGAGRDRVSAEALAPYASLRWGRRDSPASFSNTAVYGPLFYAPSALAIDFARTAKLTVIETLHFARLVNAFTAVFVSGLAILIADAGLPLLAVLLLQPMTVFLFGSVSQDALIISVSAFVAAWLTRRSSGRDAHWASWIGIGLLLGAVAAARLAYFPIGAVPAIVAWAGVQRRQGMAAAAVAFSCAIGWFVAGVAPLGIATRGGGGLLDGTQMQWLLGHGRADVLVFWHTFQESDRRLQEMVGILGWLDTLLPTWVYVLSEYLMLAALLATIAGPVRHVGSRLLVLLTLAMTFVFIYLALFLSWTRAGAAVVDGVQGRYLIPVAMFGVLLGSRDWERLRLPLAVVIILALAALDTHVALPAVGAHLGG